ncbi:host attachment protein [Croceicoccus ponticola]|uniref:Host attachment protein n=1 Tax=Croceicoccus ponticola TaxID=2217664 RepID=A0A437H290_9SPHN|nr:host attachment family protein [Croceicoccus ponticola]RVQ69593.1 host attachment protein [Croceicoccus ponticola]
MKLPHDTIVLIADGARMLLLRNHGDTVYPDLRVIEHRHCESLANRDLLSDAPGVSSGGGFPGSSTLAKTDPHSAEESRFLASAADALGQIAKRENGGIVVAASPVALGELRRAYTPATKDKLIAEIDKDYTRMPVEEITRQLAEL